MWRKHHSEETKCKISLANSGSRAYWFGKRLSSETKHKISVANTGKIPWNKGKQNVQFCSTETRAKMSKSHEGKIISVEQRKKISKARKGWCPSKKTREKWSKLRKGKNLGKDNPNWKGGVSFPYWKPSLKSLQSLIRHSPIYKLWRTAVFHRDKFQCQDCGKIGGNLHAHHIYFFSKLLGSYGIVSLGQAIRTEELWDINLGITLCLKCHKKRHLIKMKEAVNARKANFSGAANCQE